MLKDSSYSKIVENQGFKELSNALYSETIEPMTGNGKTKKPDYEIFSKLDSIDNYHSDKGKKIILEFIYTYNKRLATEISTNKDDKTRTRISEEGLKEVLKLLEDIEDIELFKNLLLAYSSINKKIN